MTATARVYSTGGKEGIHTIEYYEDGKLVRTMKRGEHFKNNYEAYGFLLEVGMLDNMKGETSDDVEWVRADRKWHVMIPLQEPRLERNTTCDFLKFSDKAGGHLCFHHLNECEDCEYSSCPILMVDGDAKNYEEDMKRLLKCKYHDGQHNGVDYCKTYDPEPAIIPVECGGDANKCSLTPSIIMRIWNIIYWRRR